MKLVVTVIHRGAPKGEDGLVYVVDWETKTVLRTLQPPSALAEDSRTLAEPSSIDLCSQIESAIPSSPSRSTNGRPNR